MAQRAASYGAAVLHKRLTMKHGSAKAPQYEASPFHSDMKHFAYAPYDVRKWKMRVFPFVIYTLYRYINLMKGKILMEKNSNKLVDLSVAFAVEILNLVKYLKSQHETIICNQIGRGRAGTSIGANIHEAQYAHGKADFVSKLQIALKESNETSYWLLLLSKTNIISPVEYNRLENLCKEIRITLIASVNTTKRNDK